MTIRLTGMNSGLDTDAIIQELVSAYRAKGDKIKKQQTRLSWTQDKWKSINAKVLNLYKSLDKMRFASGYNMKKTTVSNTSKATVTASKDAVNGTHTLKIKTLAKGGYLSSAQLKQAKSGSTKLSDLGFTDVSGKEATYRISGNGVTKDLKVDGNTTIDQFVKQINNSGTGVTASYDNTNKRIYITSKETGSDKDFMLIADNDQGAKALDALGLNVSSKTASEEAALWMKYYDSGAGAVDRNKLEEDVKKVAQAKQDRIDLKEDIDEWKAENSKLSQASKYVGAVKNNYDVEEYLKSKQPGLTDEQYKQDAADLSQFANMKESDRSKNYARGEDGKLRLANDTDTDIITYESLKNKYDIVEKQDQKDENGDLVVDANDNVVQEATELFKQIKSYNSSQKTIESYEKDDTNKTYVDEVKAIMDDPAVTDKSEALAAKQKEGYDAKIEQNKQSIISANESMEAAAQIIQEHKNINSSELTVDLAAGTGQAFTDYVDSLAEKVQFFADNYKEVNGEFVLKNESGGHKVDATDAVIELNGVEYTSSSNSFNINGLTIDAHETTGMNDDDAVTLTTATDTQGLYDKIKDFLTEYNAIISEMSSLYNAESSKGYEPLTAEEKEALSESDIADWEKKIKDSLLRRDSTLGGLLTSMTSAMSASVTVNGKKYSLASLGIKTGNYFGSTAATRYMYHIDGDADDDETSANADKLMAMLKSDPDTVIEIMKGATQKLYEGLNKKMESTSLSSFQSIYNDKSMAQSYSDYTKKITAWEEKVAQIEDSYYKKFAAMETALAKLQSQQSSLAGLLG